MGCTGTCPIGINPKTTWKTFSSAWKFTNGKDAQKPLANLSLLPVCFNQLPPVISPAAFLANGPYFWKSIFLPKGLISPPLLLPPPLQVTVYQLPVGLCLHKLEILWGQKRNKRSRQALKSIQLCLHLFKVKGGTIQIPKCS